MNTTTPDAARNAGNSALALVKAIERTGGVLEGDWECEHGRVRRYWIDLGEHWVI